MPLLRLTGSLECEVPLLPGVNWGRISLGDLYVHKNNPMFFYKHSKCRSGIHLNLNLCVLEGLEVQFILVTHFAKPNRKLCDSG